MSERSSQLMQRMEKHIQARTGRRLRNLDIQINAERVVINGQAPTYYVKQLAQHGVRELLPTVPLINAIAVV